MAKKYNANLTFELLANAQQFNSELKKARGGFDGFVKNINRAAGFLAGGFLVGEFAQVGQQIVNTRAEFSKLEAVLANTLGSNSAASIELKRLANFARENAQSTQEVTDSFIKLTNRGLKPTTDELGNLLDLASASGKSLDQVAEATLDAVVGENERLKELGIRAKDAGDTVQFTFRGITTEVEKSSEAIKDYIFGLGEVQGVAGATEAVANSLSGQLKQFESGITDLRNELGKLVEGEGAAFLGFLTSGIKELNDFLRLLNNDAGRFSSFVSLEGSYAEQEKALAGLLIRQEKLRKKANELQGTLAFDGVVEALKEVTVAVEQQRASLSALADAADKAAKKKREAASTTPTEVQANGPAFTQGQNFNDSFGLFNPIAPQIPVDALGGLPDNAINPVTLAFSNLGDEVQRTTEGIDIFANTLSTALANGASVFESFKRAAVASISEVIAALIKQAVLSFVVTQILSPLGLFNAAGSVANIARGGQFGGLFGLGQFSNMGTNFSPVQITGTLIGEGTSLKGVIRNVDRQSGRMD